jgi:antitoxin VapB
MGLQIDHPEIDRLAAEVARLSGESETDAVLHALEERRTRLEAERQNRVEEVWRWLAEEVWPLVPPEARGRRITKEEREEILGYGPHGYSE